MATVLPSSPRIVRRVTRSYAIVESLYNEVYVRPMVEHAIAEIQQLEPTAAIDRVIAPGAFEIPLVTQTILTSKRYHAVLALGVILKGETLHAELIASAVTEALMRLTLESGVPVIHEVLLLANEEQAYARCMGDEINRGTEAARAAVTAARVMRKLTGMK